MAMGAKQLGGWQGRGTEGALLGKVSGARRAGGRPCQLSLCGAGRKGGKKETTASERIQSEAAGASEPWLIRASCEPPLLWSTRQVFCWSREERATRRVRAFVADRAGGGRAGSTLAVPADTQPSQTPHRLGVRGVLRAQPQPGRPKPLGPEGEGQGGRAPHAYARAGNAAQPSMCLPGSHSPSCCRGRDLSAILLRAATR